MFCGVNLKNASKKNIPFILPVNFKYERKFINVLKFLILFPKPIKFYFDGIVKIKDMPSLSKAEVSNKIFHYFKHKVKNISKINVSIP